MSVQGIRSVLVVGAGTMGHGIAQTAAVTGHIVKLADLSEDLLASAISNIRTSLEKAVEKGKINPHAMEPVLASITTGTDAAEMVADVDLVVEAVPESLELKQKLFGAIEEAASEETIFATNTSSLSVTKIAESTKRPDRVVGAHFFNPVPIMKLLEVVRAEQTSDGTVEAMKAFGEKMGKTVIVVRDTPGFATSRLGVILGLEAIRMLEQDVASAEDIDRAMELGYRHPMGPLKLTDLVGLDVRLDIADYLHRELGGDQYVAPDLLRQMVAEGKLGKKSGQGFYAWE